MAQHRLHANAIVDMLNRAELREELSLTTESWIREMARGVEVPRFDADAAVTGGAVTLPGAGGAPLGPESGFVWKILRITADGLAAGDTLTVYRNAVLGGTRLGTITATAPYDIKTYLHGGERLLITGTGLTATGDIVINGEAHEVTEADLFKIL